MAAKSAAAAVPATPDYGLDAPREFRRWISRGVWLILLGAGFYVMNQGDAWRGGAALFAALAVMGLACFAAAVWMYWSSRVAKVRYREAVLDAIPWTGNEKVLDVGCGRGLFLIGAAKRLKSGKATGVDIWSKEHLSGNSPESAMANAKAEGVAERVRVENSDTRRLPYQANSYDVVLSALAVHNLPEDEDRVKTISEMLRVLKPGGHLAIFDIFHTGDYIQTVEQSGAEVVRKSGLSFLWCAPARWFVARKKA